MAAGAGAIHVHVATSSATNLSPALTSRERSRRFGTRVRTLPSASAPARGSSRICGGACPLIRSWNTLPDFASVNLHEVGAAQVIELLLERGVGVEAGIWNAPAAASLIRSGLAGHCLRVLLEPAEASCSARANLLQMEEALVGVTAPRLLHGLGHCAWHVVDLAARRGYDTRIGFEDTLRLPDGSTAAGNAELVRAARRIVLKAGQVAV